MTSSSSIPSSRAPFGPGFKEAVKVEYYLLGMANAPVMTEVRDINFKPDFPASTLVEVGKLARNEFMLEIEAIAVSSK